MLSKQINLPENILKKINKDDFEKDIRKFIDLFPINIETVNKNYFNPSDLNLKN